MAREKKEKRQRGYFVEKGSFFVHASVTILAVAAVFRLLGTMNCWADLYSLLLQIALPIGSAALFALFILLLGRAALWTTILPVIGGAAFFILESSAVSPSWPMFLSIALSFLAVLVYAMTLLNLITTKWVNVLVLALILAYQIVFRAMPLFSEKETILGFYEGMELLSAIGMVLALLCASLAFKRRKPKPVEEEAPAAVTVADAPAAAAPIPAAATPIPAEPAVPAEEALTLEPMEEESADLAEAPEDGESN